MIDRCRSSNLSLSFSSMLTQHQSTHAVIEHTYSHSSAVCVVLSRILGFFSSAPPRKKSSRPSVPKSISSTSSDGLSNSRTSCEGFCSLSVSFSGFPAISSSTFRGSTNSAGGVICCFNPEPLGSLGEFRDVVDELNFPETFREEDRGLKPGLAIAPGAR